MRGIMFHFTTVPRPHLLTSTPVTRSLLLAEYIYSRSGSTAKATAMTDGIDSVNVAVGDIMSRSRVCGWQKPLVGWL